MVTQAAPKGEDRVTGGYRYGKPRLTGRIPLQEGLPNRKIGLSVRMALQGNLMDRKMTARLL